MRSDCELQCKRRCDSLVSDLSYFTCMLSLTSGRMGRQLKRLILQFIALKSRSLPRRSRETKLHFGSARIARFWMTGYQINESLLASTQQRSLGALHHNDISETRTPPAPNRRARKARKETT